MRRLALASILLGLAACVAACVIRVQLSGADGSLRHALATLFGHRAEIARWHGWSLSVLVTGTALIALGVVLRALAPAPPVEDERPKRRARER